LIFNELIIIYTLKPQHQLSIYAQVHFADLLNFSAEGRASL